MPSATDPVRLPRVDELPPNLALMMLGKALAQAYEDADAPLPPSLAELVRQIEQYEAQDRRSRASDA
jgi:hypothetical protein